MKRLHVTWIKIDCKSRHQVIATAPNWASALGSSQVPQLLLHTESFLRKPARPSLFSEPVPMSALRRTGSALHEHAASGLLFPLAGKLLVCLTSLISVQLRARKQTTLENAQRRSGALTKGWGFVRPQPGRAVC